MMQAQEKGRELIKSIELVKGVPPKSENAYMMELKKRSEEEVETEIGQNFETENCPENGQVLDKNEELSENLDKYKNGVPQKEMVYIPGK